MQQTIPYSRDFIRTAKRLMLEGHYGAALTYARDAQRQSVLLDGNRKVARVAGRLANSIYGRMETEVRSRVEDLGIRATDENIGLLVREHSPHYVRYCDMRDNRSYDHSKAPLSAEDVPRLRTINDRNIVYELLKQIDRRLFRGFLAKLQ